MKHPVLTAMSLVAVLALTGCESSGSLTGQKGVAVDAAGATSAASAAAKPAASDAAVGQAVAITGREGLAATVTVVTLTTFKAGPGAIAQPPKNGSFAVAYVLISATGGTYNFNPLYIKYQAEDGTTYGALDGNSAMAGFEPGLSAGTLTAGQKTRGKVAFDVPAGGHGLIQMTDPLGGVVAQWKF